MKKGGKSMRYEKLPRTLIVVWKIDRTVVIIRWDPSGMELMGL